MTAGVVLAGAGAAAALSTVYTPTHVAPVQVSPGDLRALSSITQNRLGQIGGGFTITFRSAGVMA